MLISKAYAQAVEIGNSVAAVAPPSAGEAFMWNMGMVLVLVMLFYMLLIRPQQKRFREHSQMLQALKKGDDIVTGGGLVGKISKITEGDDNVVVDLGNGLKVTALRNTLQTKTPLNMKPANDAPKGKETKSQKG